MFKKVKIAPKGIVSSSPKNAPSNANVKSTNDLAKSRGPSKYFKGLASVLQKTGGLVFPYVPKISVSHSATWSDYNLTHTNYGMYSYTNSKADAITVTGMFYINEREEADYYLGAIHFLRSISKMNYGANDAYAGTPPPVVEFTAYGNGQFERMPVVVSNISYSTNEDSDLIRSANGTAVGTVNTLSVQLLPYYNPGDQKDVFTLEKFINGDLLSSGWV